MTVSIGADPEMFVQKVVVASRSARQTNVLMDMSSVLPGTKEAPENLGGGFALQHDNIMLEYNVPPVFDRVELGRESPAASMFTDVVSRGARLALSRAQQHAGLSLRYSTASVAKLPQKFMAKCGPGVFRFGCSPDFNAYDRGNQIPPYGSEDTVWKWPLDQSGKTQRRFAGGHIHLGYNNPGKVPDYVVAAFMDLNVLTEVLVDRELEGRRSVYGSPGRYRPTPYGIEYRSPSNSWVVDCSDFIDRASIPQATNTQRAISRAILVGKMIETLPAVTISTAYKAVDWKRLRAHLAASTRDEAREVATQYKVSAIKEVIGKLGGFNGSLLAECLFGMLSEGNFPGVHAAGRYRIPGLWTIGAMAGAVWGKTVEQVRAAAESEINDLYSEEA